jgi:putative Flp pilus-assembly TadE/G-like protein
MGRNVFGDRRGSISVLSALTIVGVVGFSALALEYGYGLLQQVENQRIADLAAYSGALVYNSTNSSSSASSAVSKIASLNGLSSTAASASVGSSPSGDGNQAVQVTVSTSPPLLLARVLTTNTTLPVSAVATAEINANAPGCIIALSGSGSGISLSGTGSITANDCQVESNSTICANSGANPSDKITTKYLSYGSGANPTTSHCTISPPSGTASVHVTKATASDPLAGNSEVSGATSRISTVASMTSPSAPSVPTGTNYTFSSGAVSGLPGTCTDSYASSTHTVTCTGTGPFNFGSVLVSGCCSVIINNTSAGATYNFGGVIDSGTGSGLTINGGSNATYNMAGGLYGHGSTPMSFSAGTFNIGTYSSSCSGTTGYSICLSSGARITFGGPSTFVLAGGIYQGASGMPPNPALKLGYGSTTNSFNIGQTAGYSLNNTNGGTLFGDASGTGDLFQMAGSLNTTGGTCVAVSAAAEHDINGSISGAGGIVLGSGIYTVNGYVALGNSGGGDVSNCPTSGTTTGLTGLEVTLVVSGASTVSCGSAASAFCLGAGFSTVKLTAPTSSSTLGSSTAGLAVIGPQSSSNTAGASFVNGASGTRISGAFYFPNGPIVMSGAATLQDTVDASACLELIGSQVTSTAGSAIGSTCTGLGSGSTGTTIGLVK